MSYQELPFQSVLRRAEVLDTVVSAAGVASTLKPYRIASGTQPWIFADLDLVADGCYFFVGRIDRVGVAPGQVIRIALNNDVTDANYRMLDFGATTFVNTRELINVNAATIATFYLYLTFSNFSPEAIYPNFISFAHVVAASFRIRVGVYLVGDVNVTNVTSVRFEHGVSTATGVVMLFKLGG